MTALRRRPPIAAMLPLEPGDRLTRAEFHRRYQAMPNLKKAELLEGIVYMPSPISLEYHSEPDQDMNIWLGYYRVHTLGVRGGGNTTIILDEDNEPQPDGALCIPKKHGGQVELDAGGFVVGAPEFIGETASTSASYDLGVKKQVYRRSGVREYVVYRVRDAALDWFRLHDGNYEPVIPDADGIIKSEQFPGLWLNVPAFVAGDMLAVLATLQRGLATPEHAAFVQRLAAKNP